MKRLLSLILAAVLLISAVPITASAAKGVTIEQKFNLLLDDLNVTEDPTYAGSYYKELAQYPADSPDWVLIHGGAVTIGSAAMYHDLRAVLGNKLVYIWADLAPFPTGFGVYDTKSGAFYDITDAWDMGFDGLKEAWYNLPAKKSDAVNLWRAGNKVAVIGDADIDGELTILDATRIQRFVAELDDPEFFMDIAPNDQLFGYRIKNDVDYDRDGELTVMDATKIQRHIAELPNMIDAKLAWDEHYYAHHDSTDYKTAYLVNSLKELDLSDSRLTKDINNPDFDAEQKIRDAYDDDFFKDKSLLVLDYSLFSGSISLTFDNVFIDKDGVLNANFSYVRYPNSSYDCAINDRFIVIEVSKAFLDDVRDIKVNVNVVRGKHYDSSIVFDKADRSDSFNQLSYDLITEYEQLDSSNTYHKKFIDTLDVSFRPKEFFSEYAYLLINLPLGSTSYTVNRVETEIDSDKMLNVNLIAKGPEIGTTAMNNRFICVKLSKDLLEGIKGHQVNLSYEFDDFSIYRPAKRPYAYAYYPKSELTIYNSLSELSKERWSYDDLTDFYGDNFFRDYSLVAINYDIPRSSIFQFSDFAVEDGALRAYMYEAKTNVDDDGTQHVRYLFEIAKSFLKNVDKAEVVHLVTEAAPDIRAEADLTKPSALPKYPVKNGYTSLMYKAARFSALDNDGDKYIGSYWEERLQENPDLTGIVGIANEPKQLRDLCYSLPQMREGAWQYEHFPPDTPYDLRDFRSGSVIVLLCRDDYSGKLIKLNGLYLKDGKLTVDASLVQVKEEITEKETYYYALFYVSKSALKNCTEIEVCNSRLNVDDRYELLWNREDPSYSFTDTITYEMITEYSDLDPRNVCHRELIKDFENIDDKSEPFRENAYLLVKTEFDQSSLWLRLADVNLDDNDVLRVRLSAEGIQKDHPGISNRLLCIRLDKKFIEGYKDCKVHLAYSLY